MTYEEYCEQHLEFLGIPCLMPKDVWESRQKYVRDKARARKERAWKALGTVFVEQE